MNRELAIQMLLQHELQRAEDGKSSLWLMQALDRGFRGFSNLTDEELGNALKQRGLEADDEVSGEDEPPEEVLEALDLDAHEWSPSADTRPGGMAWRQDSYD